MSTSTITDRMKPTTPFQQFSTEADYQLWLTSQTTIKEEDMKAQEPG